MSNGIPKEHKGKVVVQIASRAEWRTWLKANHTRKDGVWVAYPKLHTGAGVRWAEIVQEALCFGWIDSLPNKLNETHSLLWLAPRKASSKWSAVNKQYVEELTAQGLMHLAGMEKVELAKRTGTWDALNESDTLAVPHDLAIALGENGEAKKYFELFPPSARRGILEWIGNAKTAVTRTKRVAETVRLAAMNVRANTPAAKGK